MAGLDKIIARIQAESEEAAARTLEAAKAEAAQTSSEKRPSIRERLAEAKKECGERKPPDKSHQKKPPEHDL